MIKLEIAYVDEGFCRVVYKTLNEYKEEIFYCLQDEGENYGGVIFYRCSSDDEGYHEPSHTVKPKNKIMMETVRGESELAVRVNQFILSHELIEAF